MRLLSKKFMKHCYIFHFVSNTTWNLASTSFSTRRFLCHKGYLSSLTNAFTLSFHISVWLVPTRAFSLFLPFSNTLRRRLNVCTHSSDTRTRVNISFEHYVSAQRYQVFSHPRIAPFSPFFLFFAKSQWAIQSTDSPSLSLSHPRGSAQSSSYSSFFFPVLSVFIPMLLSSLVIFFFFSPTSILSSQTGPSKAYRDLFGLSSSPLWPTGKLQSVICL